jgi:hypothetical protein
MHIFFYSYDELYEIKLSYYHFSIPSDNVYVRMRRNLNLLIDFAQRLNFSLLFITKGRVQENQYFLASTEPFRMNFTPAYAENYKE